LHLYVYFVNFILAGISRLYLTVAHHQLVYMLQEIITGAGHTSAVDWWALGSQSHIACAKQNNKYA
jgi:hypothetical protein